jgi:hypothetical protein
MKIPPLKFGQALEVDWADTKSALGWGAHRPALKRRPGYVRSLGYVIEINKEALTISTSIEEGGGSLDDLSIPIGCIRRIEVLPGDWNLLGPEAA